MRARELLDLTAAVSAGRPSLPGRLRGIAACPALQAVVGSGRARRGSGCVPGAVDIVRSFRATASGLPRRPQA